jgi:hypothetical protein
VKAPAFFGVVEEPVEKRGSKITLAEGGTRREHQCAAFCSSLS